MIAEGAYPEHALKPGRHKFHRGGFRERHPDVDIRAAETKVQITIWLDSDVVDYFKSLAGAPGYQTLINQALRQLIEQGDEDRRAGGSQVR